MRNESVQDQAALPAIEETYARNITVCETICTRISWHTHSTSSKSLFGFGNKPLRKRFRFFRPASPRFFSQAATNEGFAAVCWKDPHTMQMDTVL